MDTLVRDFRALGLRVRLTHGNDAAYPADPIVVTALKRATEQSLANVLEHSERNEADVLVSTGQGAVRVQVRDRGRGFIREDVPEDRMGATTSITERMRDVGGDADIGSDPHRGTVVTIWWPK